VHFLRWLLILSVVIAAITPILLADGPPPTPVARERQRLRRKGWEVVGKLYSHNDAVMAAAGDLAILARSVTKGELYHYRYLTIQNIPATSRQDYYDCTTFMLNSVSNHDKLVAPSWGGPDNILIRVNLRDYKISTKSWDKLGAKDPYFHTLIEQVNLPTHTAKTEKRWYAGGNWQGKYYAPGYYDYYVAEAKKKYQVAAPWIDATASGYLMTTLQTNFPVLRADWFIANVSLEPFYSDFLKLKSLDDIKNLAAFDKRAERKETKGTIVFSGTDGHCPRVARNNRVLAYRPTFQGYFWETYDFKTSIGAQNVIRNFSLYLSDGKTIRDAAEYIFSLPNGLQGYSITDGKDKPIAAGDPNIVNDPTATDTLVKNARSCIVCHTEGINQFSSHFQKQIGYRPDQADLGFYDKDPERAAELRRQVLDVFGITDFPKLIGINNKLYREAILACNRREPTENAALFANIYNTYVEDRLDTRRVCYELGMTEQELQAVIGLRINGSSDPVLIQSLLKPPISIRRDQFEEAFGNAALLTLVKDKIKIVK